jgi:hypothetical protein
VQAKTIRQNHIAEIKKELADLNRFRVSHQGQARALDSRLPDVSEQQSVSAEKRGPTDVLPEELADMFAVTIAAALDDAYSAVIQWADVTIITGVIASNPVVLKGCGCLAPKSLALVSDQVAEQCRNVPAWMSDFGKQSRAGLLKSAELWISTFDLTGLPLFPGGSQGIPWQLSAVRSVSLTPSLIETYLTGAEIPRLVNVNTWKGKRPDKAALNYLAKTFSGIWNFSLTLAVMDVLRNVGGIGAPGAPSTGGTAFSGSGVLRDFGNRLPNPASFACGSPMAEDHVSTLLREELVNSTLGSAGVPAAPPPPKPGQS